MSDCEYEEADAGAADTVPTQAGSIKKGGYVMLKDFPCKVIDYSTAKPGKHGSAKATIVGIDIFTGKKYQDSCPTSHNMQVPIIKKKEFQVADIDQDNFISLVKENGNLKQDLKLPEDIELKQELYRVWEENYEKNKVFFTVISACKQEKVIQARAKTN